MHIRKLTLHNVRCFREIDLDFMRGEQPRPWTILVGPNGTGKSTLLKAIAALHGADGMTGSELLPQPSLRAGAATGFAAGTVALHGEWLASGTRVVSARVNLARDDISLANTLPNKRGARANLTVALGPVRLGPTPTTERRIEEPPDRAFAGSMRSLYGWPTGRLGDLYNWIRWEDFVRLKTAQSESHRDSVLTHLASALDTLFDGLARFREVDTRGQILFDTPDGPVPLEDLADGLRSVFVIVAELMLRLDAAFPDSKAPAHEEAICLVDEIDAHLHPRLQRTIVPALRQLFPNVQFVVTTHSPYVVGSAMHGEVIALRREGDAVVAVTDLPDVAGWPADQIATSEIFGLDTTRDLRGEAALKAERDFSGHALTKDDARKLREAKALLKSADGPLTAMVRDLLTAPLVKSGSAPKKRPRPKTQTASKKRAAG